MAELVIRRGLEEPDTTGQFVPHKPSRPEKSMGGRRFELVSDYTPAGDQRARLRGLRRLLALRDGAGPDLSIGTLCPIPPLVG